MKYCKIQHPIEGWIDYNPRSYQLEILKELESGNNIIVNAARHLGITSTIFQYLANIIDKGLDQNILIVYPTSAYNMYDRFTDMLVYNDVNNILDYRTKIFFWNYKKLYRSYGLYLKFDRVFIENSDCIDDLGGLFDKLTPFCNDIKFIGNAGNMDGYKSLNYPYTVNPVWNDDWVKCQRELLGDDLFDREYNIKF